MEFIKLELNFHHYQLYSTVLSIFIVFVGLSYSYIKEG